MSQNSSPSRKYVRCGYWGNAYYLLFCPGCVCCWRCCVQTCQPFFLMCDLVTCEPVFTCDLVTCEPVFICELVTCLPVFMCDLVTCEPIFVVFYVWFGNLWASFYVWFGDLWASFLCVIWWLVFGADIDEMWMCGSSWANPVRLTGRLNPRINHSQPVSQWH